MTTQFDISQLIASGKIQNELDFERALIADRKLRVLAKQNPKFQTTRKKLRDLIEQYENQNWSANSIISDKKLRESDVAELVAEKERQLETVVQLTPRKWWHFHKKGWYKYKDIYNKRWWIRFQWPASSGMAGY